MPGHPPPRGSALHQVRGTPTHTAFPVQAVLTSERTHTPNTRTAQQKPPVRGSGRSTSSRVPVLPTPGPGCWGWRCLAQGPEGASGCGHLAGRVLRTSDAWQLPRQTTRPGPWESERGICRARHPGHCQAPQAMGACWPQNHRLAPGTCPHRSCTVLPDGPLPGSTGTLRYSSSEWRQDPPSPKSPNLL